LCDLMYSMTVMTGMISMIVMTGMRY
jgi:hypothetical protein